MIHLDASTLTLITHVVQIVLVLLSFIHVRQFVVLGEGIHLVGALFCLGAAGAIFFQDAWLLPLFGVEQPVPGGAVEDSPPAWHMVAEWWPSVWPWLLRGLAAVLVGWMVFAGWRRLRPRVAAGLKRRADHRAERAVQAAAVHHRLEACLRRWTKLRDAYGALLLDPVRSLELQALFDLQVDSSREFHRAWTAFDDLARQVENADVATVPEEAIDRLETRAGDTENLWVAAQRHAERIGWTNLTHVDQPKAARALGLLKTATSGSATTGERDNAWALAARILAGLNLAHLPETALAEVEAQTRPALTREADA